MPSPHTGLQLEQVVPWGRNLAEYVRMFALEPTDLERRILDCGGGPASFNAELTARGGTVFSVDPLYAFSKAQIERRIAETCEVVVRGLEASREGYDWREVASPRELGQRRMATMRVFLQDYEAGLAAGRYRQGALPQLPLPDDCADLALCSHFLFTYSAQFGADFHLASLLELLRVAREVRVFPLLSTTGEPSPWLEQVVAALNALGHSVRIVPVPYRFQRGAGAMLVVSRK